MPGVVGPRGADEPHFSGDLGPHVEGGTRVLPLGEGEPQIDVFQFHPTGPDTEIESAA